MRELELVVADGSVVAYSREADAAVWDGVVTSLGCHGVVTRVTLDLVPDYDVHTFGYSAVPAEHFLEHFDEMLTDPACTSFNAMVRHPCDVAAFGFQRYVPAGSLAVAPAVPKTWHGEGVTAQRGNFGPFQSHPVGGNNVVRWHESMIWLSESKEEEFQIEYFVSLRDAQAALRATWSMASTHWGVAVQPEDERPAESLPTWGLLMNYQHIRVVRSDSQLLSPTSAGDGGDVLGIAFGLNKATGEERLLLEISRLEAVLAPFCPRPHMGKLNTMDPREWRQKYGGKLDHFVALARRHDPTGKFSNAYTEKYIFGRPESGE